MTGPDLTSGRCECAGCGLPFTSTREFDRHRVGAYAEPGEMRGLRRCLTLAELAAREWRLNPQGFWMQPRPQRAPAGTHSPRVTPPATHVPGQMR